MLNRRQWFLVLVVMLGVLAAGRILWMGRSSEGPEVVVYSGRSQDLILPLLEQFTQETGIRVRARYGQTSEMASTILEEGRRSPADLFFAQDAGALGVLARHGRLDPLPKELAELVDPRFRSPDGTWIGLSGRARVLIYHPDRVPADSLPEQLRELCDPYWRGRVGWAPANGSFQAFVTAMRHTDGESAATEWLTCMRRNATREYANNTSIVLAVAAGEIDVGLVNHYYLHALQRSRGQELNLRNHYPEEGVLVNVAGIGMLKTAPNRDAAESLISFLLSESSQRYFADKIFEYPLAAGVEPHADLPSIQTLRTPDLDLNRLDDLERTLRLMESIGLF